MSQSANDRFNSAAQAMKAHDDANAGRGDWANDSCNEVAGQFEDAAEAQPNGTFPEARVDPRPGLPPLQHERPGHHGLQPRHPAGNNNYCRAKVQLGVMAYRARDTGRARTLIEEAIRQDPTHCVEGYANLAMLLREQNPTSEQQWAEAISNIRRALALDDRYLPARNQSALSYLQQAGRPQLAGASSSPASCAPRPRRWPSSTRRSLPRTCAASWPTSTTPGASSTSGAARSSRPSPTSSAPTSSTRACSRRGSTTGRLTCRSVATRTRARPSSTRWVSRADNYDAHIGLGVALRGLAAAGETRDQAMLQQAQQEYERAQQLDAQRPDAYYNLGVLHMGYMGGQIADLERAKGFLQQFQQRAGANARYATQATQAAQHIRNIDQTIAALRAMASLPGGGNAAPTPAPTPPLAARRPPPRLRPRPPRPPQRPRPPRADLPH